MKRLRHALSLVEVLMALSISVVLLIAVVQALNSSFISYRVNQGQGMLTTRTRMILNRMLNQIRTTSDHEPVDATAILHFLNPRLDTANNIDDFRDGISDHAISLSEYVVNTDGSFIYQKDANGKYALDANKMRIPLRKIYTYALDSAKNQLTMSRSGYGIATPTTSVLLNGVKTFDVRLWPGKTANNDIAVKATITMTVLEQTTVATATGNAHQVGLNMTPDSITMSGSTSPRQNAWSGTHRTSYSIDQSLSKTH